MRYQGLAGLEAGAVDMSENAFWQTRRLDGTGDRARYYFGSLHMRRMRLDDHRTTRGKRRSRVAACRRISKREIAGAENDHRPDRHLQLAHIGFAFLRHHRVDPRLEPV